ncbi:tapasin-related protein-like [Mixophyes fleayi]|uniref:tapasin-related protein-like n=1 Tax=Mixophyes fleayi TaxID=3061075 RepID=UPI003F4D969A
MFSNQLFSRMTKLDYLFLLLLLYLTFGEALEVAAPTSHKAQLGLSVILPCTFTVKSLRVNLQFLAVIWQFQEKTIVRYYAQGIVSDERTFINEKDISKGIADLHIQNVTISDTGTYKCTIVYSPDAQTKEVNLAVYAPPVITHLEKVSEENEQNRFICSVAGFHPVDITVELLMDREVIEGSVMSSHMNDDGTFSINSTVTIPPKEKPRNLFCRVRHESLTAVLLQDLQLVHNGEISNCHCPLLLH